MSRPNVLILYTDQQRFDALGAAGNPHIYTPNLDRLAAESLHFESAFVQCPVCMPSRASFLTGQYPGTLGILHMGVPMPETVRTLPQYLKPYGYESGNLGKLHFLPHANRDHRLPHPSYGFDVGEISDEPGCYEDAYTAWVRSKDPGAVPLVSCGLPPARVVWEETLGRSSGGIEREGERDEWVTRPFAADESLTHSAFVAERTIAFVQNARAPFLAIAGFYSPHSPWVAPQRFLDLYDEAELCQAVRGYYAMVSEVDEYVGRILESIPSDTIVVFTSDHGEWLGRHGRFGKGYPGDDACSRVPLLVRIPGVAPGKREEIVEALDVLPTILEAVGAPVPPTLQGRSLLAERPDSYGALTEMGDWKALRVPGWRYLVHADGRERLWDLSTDPFEQADVADEKGCRDVLAECRHRLLTRLLTRERPLARTWPY